MIDLFALSQSGLDLTGAQSASITISPSDWVSKQCTKTVTGMTAQLAVIVSPDAQYRSIWGDCRILCTYQNTDSLTFTCDIVPDESIIVNILMLRTAMDLPVSLEIQGEPTYAQFINDPVDTTGLTYLLTRESGSTELIQPTSISPSVWGNTVGTQTLTATYTELTHSVSDTKDIQVVSKAISLSVGGSWTNTQYCGTVPDPTGLTFTCSYNDGTSKSVSGTLVSPSNWSSTPGTQTATFSYTENGVTVSANKNATVEAVIPVALSVSGDWSNAQHEGEAPNTAGLTFTATYIDGSSKSVTPIVNPTVWETGSGNQTATFSYIEEGVTVSTTKSANMTYTYDTASDGHGTVSGSGTYTYDASNAQTKSISYSPATGYEFNSWSGSGGSDCSASGQVLTINAGCHGNIIESANFSAIVYTITMATNNSTYGTTSINTATYTISGSDQTRTISYNVNDTNIYQFNSWSTGKGSISGSTLTIPANTIGDFTVTGNFGLKTFTITVQSGGHGSVSGSTTYSYSSSAQSKSISYSADSGYTFNYWSVSGPSSGSASASGSTLTIGAGSYGNITVTGYFKVSWSAVTITLTNPNSALAFRSISGNLYTNSTCTSLASANTKYTGTTFYYKSNGTKPSGSYIYNCGDGTASDSEPSKDTIQIYYNEGSLTACLGTSGKCWSGTAYMANALYYNINLSDGSWTAAIKTNSLHRVRGASF